MIDLLGKVNSRGYARLLRHALMCVRKRSHRIAWGTAEACSQQRLLSWHRYASQRQHISFARIQSRRMIPKFRQSPLCPLPAASLWLAPRGASNYIYRRNICAYGIEKRSRSVLDLHWWTDVTSDAHCSGSKIVLGHKCQLMVKDAGTSISFSGRRSGASLAFCYRCHCHAMRYDGTVSLIHVRYNCEPSQVNVEAHRRRNPLMVCDPSCEDMNVELVRQAIEGRLGRANDRLDGWDFITSVQQIVLRVECGAHVCFGALSSV